MQQVSVAQLKAHLSKYLERVQAGEEVLITDRGRPVAKLSPVWSTEQQDAHLEGLIRTGVARPPRGPFPADFWDRPRPQDPEGRALTALLEEWAQPFSPFPKGGWGDLFKEGPPLMVLELRWSSSAMARLDCPSVRSGRRTDPEDVPEAPVPDLFPPHNRTQCTPLTLS